MYLLPKDNPPQPIFLSALLAHTTEHTPPTVPLPQLPRRAVLGHAAVAQDEDPVKVGDGRKPVRDDYERSVRELLANGPLNQGVGGHVHRACGLVKNHHFGAGDDGACQAEQLALALRKVQAALGDGRGEVVEDVGVDVAARGVGGRGRNGRRGATRAADEVYALEGVAELGVGVLFEGVEIGADGAREEYRVLGYQG